MLCSDHHVYECNRPPWGENKSSTSDLNRYLWYFERYFNHSQSGKVAEKQLEETQHKMDDLASEAGMHVRATDVTPTHTHTHTHTHTLMQYTIKTPPPLSLSHISTHPHASP